jgi:hypothetical protein
VIAALRGVTWEWRADAPADAQRQVGMGVIAQEVRAVLPSIVEETGDGLLRVDYDGLIPPLLHAVATLGRRTRTLEMAADDVARVSEAAGAEITPELDPEAIGKVFPQLVVTGDDGEPTVAYEGLIGLLIEAVKELDARVGRLESES